MGAKGWIHIFEGETLALTRLSGAGPKSWRYEHGHHQRISRSQHIELGGVWHISGIRDKVQSGVVHDRDQNPLTLVTPELSYHCLPSRLVILATGFHENSRIGH